MRNDAINMEVNEGLLAFGTEEEGAVGGVVHEEIFVSQVRVFSLACDVRKHRRPKSVAGGKKNADRRRFDSRPATVDGVKAYT